MGPIGPKKCQYPFDERLKVKRNLDFWGVEFGVVELERVFPFHYTVAL